MVKLALLFGPAEYFALMVLALTTVTAVLGDSLTRGLSSLFIGLALGLVGIDLQTGQARFTLGIPELLDGIDTVVVAVGLFAVGETLYVASRYKYETEEIFALKGSMWMSKEDWRRSWKPWLRGTLLGFPIGALPAGGSEIPTFLSYLIEKRLSKNPEEFGHGAIEAVAGPEAANNAAAAGVLVPLLSLGLPTSATAAIMLAAFQQYGLQPGPLLFDSNPELVWGMIASLYIGNVLLLVLNLPMAGVWVKLLAIPRPWLYAGILVFATMGVYTLNNNVVDLVILWVIGILGFVMRVLRRAGRAVRGRPDPRAAGRAAVPPRAGDQPGRRVGVLHPPDLAGAAGDRRAAGDRADPAAPPPERAPDAVQAEQEAPPCSNP